MVCRGPSENHAFAKPLAAQRLWWVEFFSNFWLFSVQKESDKDRHFYGGYGRKITMVVEHYMHPPVHGEQLEILLPGRYENLRRVGSGATSVVFRAHDRFLDLPVAIKCLKSHHSDYHHVRRFQKEAKLMSGLNCQHLPRVFDF